MKTLLYILIALAIFNLIYVIRMEIRLEKRIDTIEKQVTNVITAKVTATMYNAVPSQCDKDPFITAGMYKINPDKASNHRWIAMSRDLLVRWGGTFNYGDTVIISGAGHKSGSYLVVDTMNKRFKNKIDILETVGTKHYKFNDVVVSKSI